MQHSSIVKRSTQARRFSIVIPAKDEAQRLPATIASLIEQREMAGLDFEVIVVVAHGDLDTLLAGSDADTLVMEPLSDLPTIARARQLGSDLSSAQYIVSTDADVRIPNLESLLKRAESALKSPEVVAWTCRIAPLPSEARRRDIVVHYLGFHLIRFCLSRKWPVARGEIQVFRRTDLEIIGGYLTALSCGEDGALFRMLMTNLGGRVVVDANSTVYHSTRRFRAWGYRSYLLRSIREYLHYFWTGSTKSRVWEPVR